ncbi:hypothetical protein OIE69_44385 (plasmid) [Actinacidiphila glaucinigra]|uniref:hypothetical protein n=1 Tax=Actinacidiphila glaucinigra TaxID=235986 RepID=UPI002DD9FEA2|nr:hypothetical protein [Actinacidiphila glaucinigra]WSD65768.1 hypothetical protein OIE69_43465 [Actinacidiphila glaucinigra]WSD65944.1 hypothetical protein OIE69_44385 [Actinacidiphila glaucinigra]
MSAPFQYPAAVTDDYAAYASRAFAAGHGLQTTHDPDTGAFTGIVAIPAGSALARQIAETAERRAGIA